MDRIPLLSTELIRELQSERQLDPQLALDCLKTSKGRIELAEHYAIMALLDSLQARLDLQELEVQDVRSEGT